MLIKFIIFIIAFGFIMRLLSRSLIGRIYKQAQQQQRAAQQQQKRARPADGNVNVQYAPAEKPSKSSDNFKGGDYVDYEEVKD